MKSRRNFLRGAGVALALPWMESLPVFGAQDGLLESRRGSGQQTTAPFRLHLLLERRGSGGLGRQGLGRRDGVWPGGGVRSLRFAKISFS